MVKIKTSLREVKYWIIEPCMNKLLRRIRFQELKKYKDIHKGKRIIILATGPSLRIEDVKKFKNEITIGVNGILALHEMAGWDPMYYCVSDPSAFNVYGKILNKSNVKTAFLDYSLREKAQEIYCDKTFFYGTGHYKLKYIKNNHRKKEMYHIEKDIYKYGINACGRSIATWAVQLAIYMGAKEIYLYGLDCSYKGSKLHFDQKTDEYMHQKDENIDIEKKYSSFTKAMMECFEAINDYAQKNDIKIYNITRGGALEVFKRKSFDECLFYKE